MSFFTFPEDAHWNPELECVEFSVAIGAYEGTVRAPAELFRRLLRAQQRQRSASMPIIFSALGSNALWTRS
jgi:hypothetical protein